MAKKNTRNFRKIIEFGKSSYVVSLPKDWLNESKLSKGDSIYMVRDSSKLVLFPIKNNTDEVYRKTNIDISGKSIQEIRFRLVSAYIRNFDEINLIDKDMKNRSKKIRELIHNLMSLEVIEESSEHIKTKVFLNPAQICPLDLIKKMDHITREMIIDSKKTLIEDNYLNISDRDSDVNRLSYLIFRLLKNIQISPLNTTKTQISNEQYFSIWVAAENIEKIADRTKWISKLLRRIKLSKHEQNEFTNLYSNIEQYYIDSMKAFYEGDEELAFSLGVRYKQLIKQCRDFHRQSTGHEWIPITLEKLKDIISNSKELLTYVCNSEKKMNHI